MRSAAVLVLLACGTPPAPPSRPSPSSPPRATTLDDLGWLAGTWHSTELDARWWRAGDGDALWGVALPASGEFEVNLIRAGSAVTLLSIENGDDVTRFRLAAAAAERIELADDAGRRVTISRDGSGWRGRYLDVKTPAVEFAMQPGSIDAAPELADLDRAFAADVAARGGAAWVSHFGSDGGEWTDHRVELTDLDALMRQTLAGGATLTWEPQVTGRRADIGFTLGGYRFARAGKTDQGSYCTIWRRDAGGKWAIAFDIGSRAE